MFKYARILFILTVLVCLFPQQVSAEILFEEDFSQDLSKWYSPTDTPHLWKIIDGQLDAYIAAGYTNSVLIPTNEYWQDAWKNYIFEFEYSPHLGTDKNIPFWYQDEQNWYQIHFVHSAFNLVKVKNGLVQEDFNIFGGLTLTNHRTYRVKIVVNEGKVTVVINDKIFTENVDPSFAQDHGRIALKASTGSVYPTHVRIDNIVVRSLDDEGSEVVLDVPLIKQSDSAWKDLEYDTAQNWSDQTSIGTWGCALTSMSMVLRYHGISTLLDGTPITPATLNQWLNSQPDGYIGNGLVNWVAVTRLTQKLSEQLGTSKLEYGRLAKISLPEIIEQIDQQQPLVLEIPGHFLVGTGYTDTTPTADVFINDPAYDLTLLSQHEDAVSARVFTPSQTDLSYLLVVTDPTFQLELRDEKGTILEQAEIFTESMTATSTLPLPSPSADSSSIQLLQLAKPTAGKYRLHLSHSESTPYTVQILAYDHKANLTLLEPTGTTGPEGTTITLEYNPAGTSQLIPSTKLFTYEDFLRDIDSLFALGEIYPEVLYSTLRQTSEMIFTQSNINKPQAITMLIRWIEYAHPWLSETAQSVLSSDLQFLLDTMQE